MRGLKKYIFIVIAFALLGGIYSLNADRSIFSLETPEVTLVPEEPQDTVTPPIKSTVSPDTSQVKYPVSKIVPEEYRDILNKYPIDLKNPESFSGDFIYDPATNTYRIKSKIGDMDVTTPFSLTPDEYMKYSLQRSMDSYFRKKYDEEFANQGEKKDILSGFDFNFDLGPAEKLFGKGGVQLNAQGGVDVKMAITHTSNGNPTLTESQRKRTAFDFDTQIQASASASVGDKINFDLNYDTKSVFDFDTKKLKLAYQGKEDEILKVLEAGNVSMNTTNSLIRGGAALFGIKTELQFGKLTVGAIFSQQESQSRTVSTQGTAQTIPFEITADAYDENRHFFLAQYFRDIYDNAMSTLPMIGSGIKIERVEVWVTNKRSDFNEARNVVAFSDLGENKHISNTSFVTPTPGMDFPSNGSNNLYSNLITNYPNLRDISKVDQTFQGTSMEDGRDYEKIESARRLTASEYYLNAELGYISLSGMSLQPDEILAVAFEYKYQGQVYQVGEFSTDNSEDTKNNLYLKLLKGSAMSPDAPFWDLMMKNIYSLNANSVQREKFKLNIKYQSDTTGTYLNYIPEGDIANQLLLRVLSLDRLDATGNPYPDGYFDFQEGYTIIAQSGKIIFPVVEPFGSYLRKKIGNDDIADKYVFQELYDSTLTVAKQNAEKNKFILEGEYKGSASSSIDLGGTNIARGSVRVTANGIPLVENVHYTIDYNTGNVTIIDPTYESAKIEVSSENQSNFGMQRKTMMGLNLNYAFNPKFNIGATVMNLSEMPLTMKANMGEEAVNNTLYGFNINYSTQSQWLTNMVDKLPFVEATAPSLISFSGEFAHLVPGHYESKYGGNYSYIDDFEKSKMSIDLRAAYSWNLSSTPSGRLFPEASLSNDLSYGNNRALLAWYYIDGMFTRSSSLTPSYLKNKDLMSNHYVREVKETELFPNKQQVYTDQSTIPVLNLAFYPKERGPYNLDATGVNHDGTLSNPKSRWGGITRRIENGQTDFEASNIEYIEFWLMDPFIYEKDSQGGDLYFNLGEISEDVLKDGRKFFENGLPLDKDPAKVDTTVWGVVPNIQSLNYAFDNTTGARKIQDVGLNGLSSEDEMTHSTYVKYLQDLENRIDPGVWQDMLNDQFSPRRDPSGDTYHYFRGSDYDAQQASVLYRYKRYNGTEGNSVDSDSSPEKYNTAAKLTPDVEDINQDNTLNGNEKFFQYRVSIRPDSLIIGKNYVSDKREALVTLPNGDKDTVAWYQFKIPVRDNPESINGIKDFKTIRFMRMFLTNFADSVILRFGTLELVHGEWRNYTRDLSNPNLPPSGNASVTISTVNIEENSDREPVNYILPPGVNRIMDPSQPQLRQQNEQALSVKIADLAPGDARAIYKNTGIDTRQYKRLQMFTHAEKFIDDTSLQNDELSIFLRLGSDYKNNYYEYEIPLKLTPAGHYIDNSTDREAVWPNANMFDFDFETLTNLKLQRNKDKRKAGSSVSYQTPYSTMDPEKPMNKITVVGNPSISEIKVIMVGVRNNSRMAKSAEVWINELRLTEFNEDGGWAANANFFLGLSDLGSLNFSGRKETAGFGGLDQGIMERSLDDRQQYSISAAAELGKFFPEKAKISMPFHYSYMEDVVSPKYNPLDQDVLLKDALDAVDTKAEKDSIKNFAQEKISTKSIGVNNFKMDIRSKNPMPYDPANFSLGYVFTESKKQDATTAYDRMTDMRASLMYNYSPMIKTVEPFKSVIKGNSGSTRLLKEFGFNFLPGNIGFTSDITRNYYEVQLRDLNSPTGSSINPSFREDFYWNRAGNIQWNVTKNLNLSLTTGTKARIDAPHVQVNKQYNRDDYAMWKDSVWQSIRDFGTPLSYQQLFSATYDLPLKLIPIFDFMSGQLMYNATYNWDKGAKLQSDEYDLGNTIRNERTIGLSNLSMNFTILYNKSHFLSETNRKFNMKRPMNQVTPAPARRSGSRTQENKQNPQDPQNAQNQEAKKEDKKPERKKYEKEIILNMDSSTIVNHKLENKRLRVTARGENGKLYELKFKAKDKNTIEIKNKDTVKLKLTINQLQPLEETTWYKVAQVGARALMMLRSANVSYNVTSSSMIPGFGPNIGDFFGQGSSDYGKTPGLDFAFGMTDEDYLDKADSRGWLVKNPLFVTPAIFGETETFMAKATLEPITGFIIDVNASRISTDRKEIDFMVDGMPRKYTGSFNMTTIAIGSSFEGSNSGNNYYSKTFQKFLDNRQTIYNRLEQAYNNTNYPTSGFFNQEPYKSDYAGKPFSPTNGNMTMNSTDVLIPAFLAAYTGRNAGNIALTAFPALSQLLPNWKVTYNGLMQLEAINKHFKSFQISHEYNCRYVVGAYSSYASWVDASSGGLGYIKSLTDTPIPSSPYEISAASITEAFNPLLGIDGVLKNNITLKFGYRKTRNINLNVSAYQIVEVSTENLDLGLGYKLTEFNKTLKIRSSGGANFSNDLTINGVVTFQKMSNLIRKIQDGFTQASVGESQTIIKLSADYNLSRSLTIQAFFDRMVTNPLVSTSAYPMSKSSFGFNIKLNLLR